MSLELLKWSVSSLGERGKDENEDFIAPTRDKIRENRRNSKGEEDSLGESQRFKRVSHSNHVEIFGLNFDRVPIKHIAVVSL